MSETTTQRGHLTLERVYDANPSRVFNAFATEAGLAAWWSPGPGVTVDFETFEFRVGGTTRATFTHGERVFRNHLRYEDIVPDRRIVAVMTMWTGAGATSSVNVLSVDVLPEGEGCRLVLGEHGAFLDGLESSDGHRGGFTHMLERLGSAVAAHEVAA